MTRDTNQAADALNTAVSFGSDPLGFLFAKTQEAAHGLSERLLPVLIDATKPDFSAEWFLEAYAVSYAAAVFLWVTNLLWTIMQSARGIYTSDDVMEVLTTRAGLFFGMSTFGPAAGWLILQFFGSLTEAIARWGVNSSVDESIDSLAAMIEGADPAGVVGGVLVALVLMTMMLLGLVLVALSLFVTTVTAYIGGAASPLALAWLANPVHHRIATRVVTLIVGMIAAKPLLFFVLGVTYRMGSASVTWLEGASTDVQTLANLCAAMIGLCVAGLTPFLLFKFVPVTPTGAGQAGPALHRSSGDRDSGDQRGSQTQRRARENLRRRAERQESESTGQTGTTGSGDSDAGSGSGHGGGAGGGHEPGPIQKALEAKQREKAGTDGAAGESASEGAGGKVPVGAGVRKSAAGGEGGAPGATSTAAAATKSGAAKSSAGAGGGAASGSRVAGGAAGAVGVGAAAAYQVAKKSAEKGAQAGDVAAREMDDRDRGGEAS